MNKKSVFVLLTILIVLFSFGCKEEETPGIIEEPEEELPEVVRPVYNFVVNNYPSGEYDMEDFLVSSCGSLDCDYTKRNFTLAKVEKIDGRKLELNLYNEIVNVEIGKNVTYELFIHRYDLKNKISELIPTDSEGDRFEEIRVGDLIGVYYKLDGSYEMTPQKIMIIKLE